MKVKLRSNRKLALERDNNQCIICGFHDDLQVHHIVHKCKYGSNELDNLVTVCSCCHLVIHNKLKRVIRSGDDPKLFKFLILYVRFNHS